MLPALQMNERSLRHIEDGETQVVSQLFDQLIQFYQVDYKVIFELAQQPSNFQNVIHTISGEKAVINQNLPKNEASEDDPRTKDLEQQIQKLEENERYLKGLIEKLMAEKV